MSSKTSTKTATKKIAVKKIEVKERVARKSKNPRLQKIAESSASSLIAILAKYCGSHADELGDRGSRGVVVPLKGKETFVPLGTVMESMGFVDSVFPSGSPEKDDIRQTLAHGGKGICRGDILRVLDRAGIKTWNKNKVSLPKNVRLVSEVYAKAK